jgi:hypothetical protein
MKETDPTLKKVEGQSGQVYTTLIYPDETPDQLVIPSDPPPADLAHGE